MKPPLRLALAVAVLAGAAALIYFVLQRSSPTASSPAGQGAAPATPSSPNAEAQPKYPVDAESQPADGEKYQATDLNGQTLESALSSLVGQALFDALIDTDNLPNRIVVALDTATAGAQLPSDRSPIKPPDSAFVATKRGKQEVIAEENYVRYKPYVDLVSAIDSRQLVDIYVHFYPILQSAYRELGTKKYFNDRVVEVLDHILRTPEVAGNPIVSKPGPNYMYKFSDVELENLSSSQKVLLRMGYDNAKVIRLKFTEIRRLLAHLGKGKAI